MTKEEAISEMKKGKMITHKYFGQDEWATMGTNGQIILEDGVECHPSEFWRWRTDTCWNEGWEFFNEDN